MKDLKQQAAMPLASFLRIDPWTDQLVPIHAAFEPLLSDRDKMPFEVEPVYLKLTYFASATSPDASSAATAAGSSAPDNAAPPPATAASPAAQQAAPTQ
jgi:hypothetical protein